MTKEKLPPEDQAIWEEMSGGRPRLPLVTEILMYRPKIAKLSEDLSRAVRADTSLDRRTVEFIILIVARELNCLREWSVHINQARNAGVSEETLEAIKGRKAPDRLTGDEKLLATFTCEILHQYRVSTQTFEAVRVKLGDIGVIDLSELIGHYSALAVVMNAFEVEPPDDPALLLPV